MGPAGLSSVLASLARNVDPNVVVGYETGDDAGVYRLNGEEALIQTVDFFSPIVNDPFLFGRIAATNALSDVYAMGGRPRTALNIVCFPEKKADLAVLKEILRGGTETCREAGVALLGGHSVDDDEVKFGMAVTGFVRLDRLQTNAGARVGDRLVLTKPLGTGILATALKMGKIPESPDEEFIRSMTTLNDTAAACMADFPAHACTDVTGFGLVGHLMNVARASKKTIRIDSSRVPLFDGAMRFVRTDRPRNIDAGKKHYGCDVSVAPSVTAETMDVLYDPQTSGGLVIFVEGSAAESLLARLHRDGVPRAEIIGEVTGDSQGAIQVQ